MSKNNVCVRVTVYVAGGLSRTQSEPGTPMHASNSYKVVLTQTLLSTGRFQFGTLRDIELHNLRHRGVQAERVVLDMASVAQVL